MQRASRVRRYPQTGHVGYKRGPIHSSQQDLLRSLVPAHASDEESGFPCARRTRSASGEFGGGRMGGDGSVFWRCGCRHRAGPCPRSGRQHGHGSWYFSLNVPDPGGGQVRRVRRGGYRSRTAAARALAAVRHPYTDTGRVALTVGGWLREWIGVCPPPNPRPGNAP